MTRGKQTEPGKRLLGYILVTVGILWMLLCGACTGLVFAITISMNRPEIAEVASAMVLPLIIGLVGAAPGLLLLLVGRSILRPKLP